MLLDVPFDGAADGGLLFARALAGAGNHRHGLEQFAPGVRWAGSEARCIEPAPVLELQLGVVAEEVGRAHGAVSFGHRLRRGQRIEENIAWPH